jgi:hypothetical protein
LVAPVSEVRIDRPSTLEELHSKFLDLWRRLVRARDHMEGEAAARATWQALVLEDLVADIAAVMDRKVCGRCPRTNEARDKRCLHLLTAGQLPPELQEAHDLLYRAGYTVISGPLAWESWERADAPGRATG